MPTSLLPHFDDEKRMTFTEHLGELRDRILRAGAAVIVAVVLCYVVAEQIYDLIVWPLKSHVTFHVFSPLEFFLLKLRLAAYGGVVVAFPYILWQACAFVFPGLKESERRVVQIMIAASFVLATAGTAVAYFVVLPLVLPYLMSVIPDDIVTTLNATQTMATILRALAGFAAAFQFPMVVLVLVYLGLLTPAILREYRRIAFVAMAVVAALLTPPDPFSLIVLTIPLVLLYELSIGVAHFVAPRGLQPPSDDESSPPPAVVG